jgi:hypothetical protein
MNRVSKAVNKYQVSGDISENKIVFQNFWLRCNYSLEVGGDQTWRARERELTVEG